MMHLTKISIKQLFCLVFLTQVGVHVLSIPYVESKHTGYDSWLSVLLGGVIGQAAIVIIYLLGKRQSGQPLPQYIFSLIGKPLGILLNVLIAVYCAESSLIVVASYSDVISRWILFTTPWYVISGASVAIAAYIASSSLRPIAVITQSILIMFLVCFIIIVISGMGKGDWRHLLPIGTHGLGAIMKDALPAFWAYAGYELLLYVFPFVQYRRQKDIFIAMSAANGLTTFFYVLVSLIVTYSFSENQLKSIPEPMIFILRQFRWPVVQSLDILFITIWLSVTTVTVYVYLFLSARYLSYVRSSEVGNHPLLVWILAIAIFAAGLWLSDRNSLLRFSTFHNTATAIVTAILPALLLLVSLVRGRAESV